MNICLFTKQEIDKPLSLHDARAKHIIKILKKKVGDTFNAGIIEGSSGIALITAIDDIDENGTLSFSFTPQGDGKPLYPLIMIIGFPRPIQLKRLLRDMAGLVVCEIHLVATELGEKSYLNSSLATSDAGRTMLVEGVVQAAGTHIPSLYIHNSLNECLDVIEKNLKQDYVLFALDNVNAKDSLSSVLERESSLLKETRTAVACIGSERGWTDKERELLESKGYKRLRMGNRVLRTETAATVAASLILGAMGYLN